MIRTRPMQLISALALTASVAACGSSTEPTSSAPDSDSTPVVSAPATSEPSEVAVTSGPAAPDASGPTPEQPDAVVAAELQFSSSTVDGAAFDGADLGGKDAVLWFWAPWCVVCRGEAPHVAAVQAANADVSFVGVAALGELEEMQGFVTDYGVAEFDHLADLDGTIWQRFGVTQQPAYAFIDDSGSIEVVRGALGEEGLADLVSELTAT